MQDPGWPRLGGRIASALGRIALDRIGEARGAALPRTPEQTADAATLNELLAASGSTHRLRVASLPGVDFESSNCRNFLVATEWEPEDGALPPSLYAKLPCASLATRAFANAVGFWAVECAFARNVASVVPVRVPRVYAVVERGARFVLLLENLTLDPSVHLFDNRDMAAGTTIERAKRCLEAFATLHAAFWDRTPDEREALFPNSLHTTLAPGGRALTRALNGASIAPTHRAAPDLFEARHVALCNDAIARWDAMVDRWYREPLTLIHGDSHLANCFEYGDAAAPQVGLIDFQGMQWCHGVRDVQYFLINSLEPDLLAEHESALVHHYLDALARHGVKADADDARDRYRGYAFQTLMVACVSLGLGSLTERDETLRTVLRRSVAAIDRLDFRSWLDGL